MCAVARQFCVAHDAASQALHVCACVCVCSLDQQLSQLEASLAAADAPTLELLGQSTSRWMQAAQATTAGPGAAAAPSAAASDAVSPTHPGGIDDDASAVECSSTSAAGQGADAAAADQACTVSSSSSSNEAHSTTTTTTAAAAKAADPQAGHKQEGDSMSEPLRNQGMQDGVSTVQQSIDK